jgi:cobalt/nickel transport system permease protein
LHIPDGYLGPQTYGAALGIMIPAWAYASRKVRATLKSRQVPFLALAAAFTFLIQMFNIPAPGGTTGHATGGAIAAIILGPWAAVLVMTITLFIQALVFADGGITAFGANCLNMGVVQALSAYSIYRFISLGSAGNSRRRWLAGGVAGYVSLNLAALSTAFMLGIQPLIASDPAGRPLYAPYPLSVAVPVMAFEHLVIFGFVEGIITALLVRYLLENYPETLSMTAGRPVEKPSL